MTCEPSQPSDHHVWVRPHGDHGVPAAGVVVCWQHSPVHNVNASDWLALVATNPFEDALQLGWVGAERLIPLRDPGPLDGP